MNVTQTLYQLKTLLPTREATYPSISVTSVIIRAASPLRFAAQCATFLLSARINAVRANIRGFFIRQIRRERDILDYGQTDFYISLSYISLSIPNVVRSAYVFYVLNKVYAWSEPSCTIDEPPRIIFLWFLYFLEKHGRKFLQDKCQAI